MKLILLDKAGLTYAGKRVRKGQSFDVRTQDARALIAVGKARRLPLKEVAGVACANIVASDAAALHVQVEKTAEGEQTAESRSVSNEESSALEIPVSRAEGAGATEKPQPSVEKSEPPRTRARRRDSKAAE